MSRDGNAGAQTVMRHAFEILVFGLVTSLIVSSQRQATRLCSFHFASTKAMAFSSTLGVTVKTFARGDGW